MSKTQSTRTAPKVVPQPAEPVQEPERQPKELTEIQKILTDHCAEMILRGGPFAPIDNLIQSCLGFEYRNAFGDPENCKEQEYIEKYIDTRATNWRNQLEASWPKRREKPDANNSTVTNRVRADMRGNLWDKFDEFIRRATPEEVYLMNEVLEHWESDGPSTPSENMDHPEISIAHAYDVVFSERDHHYFRVHWKQWDLVQKYLDLLNGKGKEVA